LIAPNAHLAWLDSERGHFKSNQHELKHRAEEIKAYWKEWAIVQAQKKVLAQAVEAQKAALRAVNAAKGVMVKGQRRYTAAVNRVPVAQKTLKDAKNAIVKAHSDKKNAVKEADRIISDLKGEHRTALSK